MKLISNELTKTINNSNQKEYLTWSKMSFLKSSCGSYLQVISLRRINYLKMKTLLKKVLFLLKNQNINESKA